MPEIALMIDRHSLVRCSLGRSSSAVPSPHSNHSCHQLSGQLSIVCFATSLPCLSSSSDSHFRRVSHNLTARNVEFNTLALSHPFKQLVWNSAGTRLHPLRHIHSRTSKRSFGVGNRNRRSRISFGDVINVEKFCKGVDRKLCVSAFGSTSSGHKKHGRRAKYASLVTRASFSVTPHPPQPVQKWWSAAWEKILALFVSFSAQLQKIQIGPVGGRNILMMLRIVVIAAGAFGAYIASKRAWTKIREHAGSGKGDGGPMQVLARGATCVQSNMGPWSVSDLALGLTAMAKVTEKEPPRVPGKEVKDLSQDANFLLRAQHWRALAEAVYVSDSASFSLFSNLPESSIVAASWEPDQESFRPAFAVFVDAPYGAVVLAVRGTSHVIDMLLNSGASPEPVHKGFAHGGFVHASNVLFEEVVPHIEKAFRDHGGSQNLKLVIVGHSMGAAVGTLVALKLREKYEDLQSWCFCPPACMSKDLAKDCKSFTTSFIAAHDLVPRFSFHSVENLRERIQNFNWDEVERVAKDDEDWKNTKKALETFRGFQQSGEEAMANLKNKADNTGIPSLDVSKKAKSLTEGAANSEAAAKVGNITKQANAFIEGKNESDQNPENNKNGTEENDLPPLHPPGRLLVLGSDPQGWGKFPEQRSNVASQRNYGTYPSFDEAKKATWRMMEAEQEDLEEIVVSPWCISDHMLGNMCEALSFFQSQCPPAVQWG